MEIDFYGKDKEDTMRIRLTALITILCILCSGCAHDTKPASRFEEIMASGKLGYISNAEEIEIFAASQYAPKGFVRPKSVGCIGQVTEELYLEEGTAYEGYFYILTDANQYQLMLTMHHDPADFVDLSDYTAVQMSESMDNMLNCGQELDTYAYICEDNMYYLYGSTGALMCVIWYLDGIEFTLDAGWQYPIAGERTFVTKLLSASKYERTIAMKRFLWNYRLYS